MTSPELLVQDLTKRFGGVDALADLSFEVQRGEIFGVIGANGAGKSTLLSLISGAQRPTSGQISLAGETISGLSAPEVARRGVARAHQVPRPFRELSVRQHVDLAARVRRRGRGERSRAVESVLERCRLTAKADRLAGSLGLLDLKRLGVARALALEPRLLLLDEVAAGLVGGEIDAIVELIDGVRAEGVTLIMVEHVQGLIARLADRVLVLDLGRKLTDGTPAEVAADPEVIEAYLGATPKANSAEAVTRPQPMDRERPPALLALEGVDVRYGSLPALRSCDVRVGIGEVVAVVGANGSGKSTLARTLSGVLRPSIGRVTFDGQDITGMTPHRRARRGIASCPEGRRLFAALTVEENLLVAAQHARPGIAPLRERLDAVYDRFPELSGIRSRPAGALSGGQQQMVAIGRAIVLAPSVIIFDELSLGLAPIVTTRILSAIPDLRAEGLAIILIEQNVAQALELADHVYVLDRGQTSYSGPPAPLADDEALRLAYFGDVDGTATPVAQEGAIR